ncbi:Oligo-1,6-glucosidase [compost metagenome]
MLWDDSHQAGFTTGAPWIKIDERYPAINARSQAEDPKSIYHHYRELIELRKNLAVLTDGEYSRLDDGHPQVYAYTRKNMEQTLVVISNFSRDEVQFEFPSRFRATLLAARSKKLLVGNTEETPEIAVSVKLPPYGSYMWIINNVN